MGRTVPHHPRARSARTAEAGHADGADLLAGDIERHPCACEEQLAVIDLPGATPERTLPDQALNAFYGEDMDPRPNEVFCESIRRRDSVVANPIAIWFANRNPDSELVE
jgi:hypothetical protein